LVDTNELDKLKILVTGGSRGIGAAVVRLLAMNGAQVAFTYSSSKESAEKVLNELPGVGHKMYKMDISNEASLEQSMTEILETMGGLDGLVNNAGITKDQLILRMKTQDFDDVINTNLRGTFLVTKACLKTMMKQRSGSIVHVTSVIGQTGNGGQANYSASKAGIEAFSKSVALEMASRNVRSNCVAPGFIESDMTHALDENQKKAIYAKIPLARVGSAQDVAEAISFLLSSRSNYITGQTLNVNGGLFMG
jgi:3-oxoacyl-[acyl-carrier protein] reductase